MEIWKMIKSNKQIVWNLLIATAAVYGLLILPSAKIFAQDDSSSAATASLAEETSTSVDATPPAEGSASSASSEGSSEASAQPSAPVQSSSTEGSTAANASSNGAPSGGNAGEADANADGPTNSANEDGAQVDSKADSADVGGDDRALPTGSEKPAAQSDAEAGAAGMGALALGLVIVALFVVPIFVGSALAKALNMPDYGWKIALVLGTLAASILIVTFGRFRFGPDLAGGITLIYELQEGTAIGAQGDANSDSDTKGEIGQERNVKVDQLIDALKERIDPTGTREVTIRPYGPAIEIIIPETGPDQLEYVKRRITDLGQLEFRITADPRFSADRPIIEQAKLNAPNQKNVMLGGTKVGEWVAYNEKEFGPVDLEDGRLVKRLAGKTPEALVLIDPMNVTGDFLSSTTLGADERGAPAVNFTFDSTGARLFRRLTSENKPNPANPNVYRGLGIVLDKRLISAPVIRETISNSGQISGASMGREEVEYIIGILNAGSLPAALNKTPISEEIISPTLGLVTIEKGKFAIAASLIAVMLFMLIYYRFAGFVACLVLTLNLLLVLAVMVLINAAFTLPGLAGLVLTIGMAVDANVLIYERIREELDHGAALRMAIRNGFSRAMSAIIDSNVTTIISGIALYVFATDQVKGFAVTLILGILTSMFTAIFVARLIFDIGERRGWITNLSMMRLMSQPNYDFLRMRWLASGLSLVLVALGLFAAYNRSTGLFDIDFTGGSSVTFTFRDEAATPISDVHDALMETPLGERNLVVVERTDSEGIGKHTRYSIDNSEQDVAAVKKILEDTFAGKLLTYKVEYRDVKPFVDGDYKGTEATVSVNEGPGYDEEDGISHDALLAELKNAVADGGITGAELTVSHPDYQPGSVSREKVWTVRLGGVDEAAANKLLTQLQGDMNVTSMFPLASQIGGRVSESMQGQALLAMFVSLLGVILYLWFRFQNVTYGLAAAAALFHDVMVTIAMLALSKYIVEWVPGLASVLQIDSFQIGLTIVAALLTIIGYSLNDTIVTFDRLREIKGKSPKLTAEMVNSSVNQCLSRTILTALTVFIVVVILYFLGGDGIHAFAFAFLVGTVAGTYSTVYIAAPVLLWLNGASADTSASEPIAAVRRAGGVA